MNRYAEYQELKSTLTEPPLALSEVGSHLNHRIAKAKKRQRLYRIPSFVLLFTFIAFTIGINSSPVFAYTCGQIPILKQLALCVASSPSLKAAVENQYVQPINLTQHTDDVNLTIEYLIVDQSQVNVFYSLTSSKWDRINLTPSLVNTSGENLNGYGTSWGGSDSIDDSLKQITFDFLECEVPNPLLLNITIDKVFDSTSNDSTTSISVDSKETLSENPFTVKSPPLDTLLFEIDFNPNYMTFKEVISKNESFEIDEQQLTLTDVTILPSHLSLGIEEDSLNSASLSSLLLYAENEKGISFEEISNGITSTRDVDNALLSGHRLESSFFSKSNTLDLILTGAVWCDKSYEKVKLDFNHLTADFLPEGVLFKEATRTATGWALTFYATEYEPNHSYQLWSHTYYDAEGNPYDINRSSSTYPDSEEMESTTLNTPYFESTLYLDDYPYDTAYFEPCFTHRTQLDDPIRISIK